MLKFLLLALALENSKTLHRFSSGDLYLFRMRLSMGYFEFRQGNSKDNSRSYLIEN